MDCVLGVILVLVLWGLGAVPSSFAKESRYSQAPQKIGDAMEAIIEGMTQEVKDLVWQSDPLGGGYAGVEEGTSLILCRLRS